MNNVRAFFHSGREKSTAKGAIIDRIAGDRDFLLKEITDRDHTINYLEKQLAWLKRQFFGKRSERVVSNLNNQQLLLEGFEIPSNKEEEKKTIAPHTRKKPNRNGQDKITLPDDLPVETTVLDIPDEEKVCQETGEPLVQIGVEVSHKLAHKPGSFYIKEIIRPKYAHPLKEENGILTASLSDQHVHFVQQKLKNQRQCPKYLVFEMKGLNNLISRENCT